MLVTVLLSFFAFSMVILLMAVGVILGRKPLAGSCGGVGTSGCKLCRRDDSHESGSDRWKSASRQEGGQCSI